MKMSTKPKSAAKIRGKRKRPAQAPPAEVQGELLPAEDSFERALASLRTERQRAFVRALMATWPQLDGKAAAVAAGCRAGAYETAHRWWRRPDIARAVNLWVRERLQNSLPSGDATPEQQAEEVLRTAWLMARANVLWFTRISPDRKLLIPDFSHATDDMLADGIDAGKKSIGESPIDDRGLRAAGRFVAEVAAQKLCDPEGGEVTRRDHVQVGERGGLLFSGQTRDRESVASIAAG